MSHYNEDVLLLVIPDNKYGERVPVQTGSLVIHQLVSIMTVEELQQVGEMYKHMHLSMVLIKQNTLTSPSVPEYDLDKVKGTVQTTTKAAIPLFETTAAKGQVKLNMYSKHINILIEPTLSYSQHIASV